MKDITKTLLLEGKSDERPVAGPIRTSTTQIIFGIIKCVSK